MGKQILSLRKYAELLGCTEGNVRDAIKKKKIVAGVIIQNGKNKGIDVEVANSEWGANFNTERPRNMDLLTAVTSTQPTKVAKNPVSAQNTDTETESGEVTDLEIYDDDSLQTASRKKTILEARKLKLQVAELEGRLVDKQAVYKTLFAAGIEVRNSISNVPSRVIDSILSAPTRIDAQRILTEELNSALQTVSDINKRIDKPTE